MMKHLTRLGLGSLDEYIAWCTERGFDRSAEKTVYALQDENEAHRRERERSHARRRVHRNPRKFLEQVCAGEVSADEIDRPRWSDVCRAIAATPNQKTYRDSLCEFFLSMEKKAGFVLEAIPWGSADSLCERVDRPARAPVGMDPVARRLETGDAQPRPPVLVALPAPDHVLSRAPFHGQRLAAAR